MEVVDFVIGPNCGVFFFPFFPQFCQVGELAISTRGMKPKLARGHTQTVE
jgi:hypothetical protein